MDANHIVFSHLAEAYDACRPVPPQVLTALLPRLAGTGEAMRVADLGCGTGLSTWIWSSAGRQVVGIEPNAEMLAVAQRKQAGPAGHPGVSFRQAEANRTGLPACWADVVTCSQSFHWMEPESTMAEVARILRPGGVFAAFDHSWPPVVNWQAETAFNRFIENVWALSAQREQTPGFHQYAQNRELKALEDSGLFRYTREFWLHQEETGDAERFYRLTLSNGVDHFLRQGLVRAQEIGLEEFQRAVQTALGPLPVPWIFSYHVRIGIR